MAQLNMILEELGITSLWVFRDSRNTRIQVNHRLINDLRSKSNILTLKDSLTGQSSKACKATKVSGVIESINTPDKVKNVVKVLNAPRELATPIISARNALVGLQSAYSLSQTAMSKRNSMAIGSTLEAVSGVEPVQPVSILDWEALKTRVAGCMLCRLCERRTNTVFGVGDETADWMLVGEAPGELEDKQGKPFVGQSGRLLDNMLRALQLLRGDNLYIANVLKCRPPGNRNPELQEVMQCEPYLKRQVSLLKPKVIIALGRFAAYSLLKTNADMTSLRGRIHKYEDVPVIVTYHPAYLLRSLEDKHKAWSDLCLARAVYRKHSTMYESL
ncbi:uracil-DNA glycosylase [Candidatus Vallotia lariciata]|uniref:uracil-DNA glycosylase n=1 Tax=Candidatus Vallotia laricis TaxID=2018052 RepID=UPI001D02FD9A|nr:uracil-DNA glycosylase [Candidatus Vallotia lariciata]UDG82677.1 uracil-DNA glycosylase [Candidatus Vallotia lariciata]